MAKFDNGPVRHKRKDKPNEPRVAGKRKPSTGFMALEPRMLYDAAAAATVGGQQHAADAAAADHVAAAEPATPAAEPVAASYAAQRPSADAGAPPAGTSPSHDIVFIDSQVPNLSELLAGLKPGETAVVIDPNSDGLQQIANYLSANNLHDLSGIQIVSHGLTGEIRLGNAVMSDADLAAHAAALGQIGAALAPGGDILLYGCDVASGDAGAQFIADLSRYTGGADIAAATHDVGGAAAGATWVLDATTGPIETTVPFTADTLANYQGLLNNVVVDGQLWTTTENTNAHVIAHVNDDGLNPVTVSFQGQTKSLRDIAVDTASGFYFTVDSVTGNVADPTALFLLEYRISDNSLVASVKIADPTDLDVVEALTIDPINHVVYIGQWGVDFAHSGIQKVTYNATTGALTGGINAGNDTATWLIHNSPLLDRVTDMAIDLTNHKLYIVDDDMGADDFPPFTPHNAVYVLDYTQANPTLTQLTSSTQFPAGSFVHSSTQPVNPNGAIGAIALDVADGLVYFTTTNDNRAANAIPASVDHIWYVSMNGGANQTATQVGFTGSAAGTAYVSHIESSLVFDPGLRQLYFADQNGPVVTATIAGTPTTAATTQIVVGQLDASGHNISSIVQTISMNTLTGVNAATLDPRTYAQGAYFASLATAGTGGTTGTPNYVEGDPPVAALAGNLHVSLADADGGYAVGATVTIGSGNFESHDLLSINGTLPTGITASYSTASGTGVLTLSGYATLAAYETAFEQVRYANSGGDPTAGDTKTSRTLTWTIKDGTPNIAASALLAASATTTITVQDLNAAPVNAYNGVSINTTPVSLSVSEDTDLPITLLTVSDSDAGSANIVTTVKALHGNLSVSVVGGGVTAGNISGSGTGNLSLTGSQSAINATLATLKYRASADYNGADTITVTTDDQGHTGAPGALQDTDNIAVTVTAVNDAPVAGAPTTVSIAAISEDVLNPAGTTVTSLVSASFSDAADNQTATGGSSANTLAGIVITANAATASQGIWQWSTDGTTWNSISTSLSNSSAIALSTSAQLRFLPAANWNGTTGALTVHPIDNSQGAVTSSNTAFNPGTLGGASQYSSGTVAIGESVTAVNDAPTATGSATLTAIAEDTAAPAGAAVTTLFSGNFSDAIDNQPGSTPNTFAGIAISSYGGPTSAGKWQYSTDGGANWADLGSASASSAITLAAGDKLRFLPAANYNGAATALSVNLIESGTTIVSNATVDLAAANATGGTSHISTATVALSHSVTAINDAPTTTNNTVTTTEDTNYVFQTTDFPFADPNDSPANSLLKVIVTALPTAGTLKLNGTAVTLNQAISATEIGLGHLVFTPAANANGANYASFGFKVEDNGGTAGAGAADTSSAATITVSVTAINDAPTTANNTVTTVEDTSYVFHTTDFPFADASDSPANNLLNVIVTSLPTVGALTLNGTAVTLNQVIAASEIGLGHLVFTPAANATGATYANFSFKVEDNGGTAGVGASDTSSAATITVAVTPINHAPTTSNNTVTTLEDTSYVFHTTDFPFADASDSPANSLLNVIVTSLPAAGALKLNGTAVTLNQVISAGEISLGHLVFTPTANANGASYASFGFKVEDNGGTVGPGAADTSNAATMTVAVTALNDAPTTTNNTVTTAEDTSYVFHATDFPFADASDSPANSLLNVNITTLPTAGTLKLNGTAVTLNQAISAVEIGLGHLVFTPAANANGATYASFGFKVQDDGGTTGTGAADSSSAATITVAVTSINDAPTTINNTVTTLEDANYVFQTTDFPFADANDSPANSLLNVIITSLPTAGTLKLNGTAVTLNQVIAATEIGLGHLVFTPAANANGANYANFGFKVEDNGGTAGAGAADTSNAATITVSVTALNDAPTTANNTVTTLEDTSYTFHATDFPFADANDSPANSLLNVIITSLPTAGTLKLNGTAVTLNQAIAASEIGLGHLVFTPAANANGASYASFGFKVEDNGGTVGAGAADTSSAATITVAVTAVNDSPTISPPASFTVTEDVTTALTGVSFDDVDSGNAAVLASFSVPSGALSAVSTGVVTVGGSPTALTLTGSIANINTYIAGGNLKYTTAQDANADIALHIVIDDQGNAPAPVSTPASTDVTIHVTAVNDAPVNHVPGAQSVSPLATLSLTGADKIWVNDVDVNETASPNNTLQVTLSVDLGTLTLGSISGLSTTVVVGTGYATMTFTGTSTDINAALDTLHYIAPASPGAATLTVTTNDLGHSGTGPAPDVVDTVAITVQQPIVLDLDADNSSGATGGDYTAIVVPSSSSAVPIADADISILDPASPTLTSATITLTNHQTGDLLSLAGPLPAGIAQSSYNAASGVLTLNGTASLADYQAALHDIVFSTTGGNFANRDISIVVNDSVNASTSNTAHTTINFHTLDLDTSANGTGYATTFVEATSAAPGSGPVPIVNAGAVQITEPAPTDTQTFDNMAPGPITNGENGWQVAGGPLDQEIVALLGGNQVFRMSSDPDNASFGGPYSPQLPAAAGEPDTGASYDSQSIKFSFQAVNGTPDGSRLEIDFGNASGADRNNFLAIESFGNGIRITVSEPDTAGNFSGDGTSAAPNDWRELISGVDPTVAHTLEMRLRYIDGPNNDVIDIYLDGAKIGTTTTFENYHDATPGSDHVANAIANETDRVFFRGKANGAPQDAPGGTSVNQGFYIDNLTTDVHNTIASATVTLTNTQAGDSLIVDGDTTHSSGDLTQINGNPLGGTIHWAVSSVGGNATVTLTSLGNVTAADYEAALQAISFSNSSDTPSTVDRDISIVVTDDAGANTNVAHTTVHVVAVNDAPTVTAVVDHDLVEAGGIANGAAGVATATATLTPGDVDGPVLSYDNAALLTAGWSTSDGGATFTHAGTYGTATLTTATNVVSYALDDSLAATQALNAGDHPTETFTVAVTDGVASTATSVVFTVDGANDNPTVSAVVDHDLVEAGGIANGTAGVATATASVNKGDVDGSVSYDNAALTSAGWSTTDGGLTYHQTQTYGTATLDTATNTVSFALDQAAADALTPADHPIQAFIVAVTDNLGATASTLVTFTIDGANDNPTVTAVVDHDLVEAGGIANGAAGVATATATLTPGDVDGAASYDNAALLTAGWSTSDGGATYTHAGAYGTATLTTATNVVSYALDDSLAATQALNAGDHPTETFTVAVTDGVASTATSVVFTVDGANDNPTVSAVVDHDLVEAGGIANGTAGVATATASVNKGDVDGSVSYDNAALTSAGWATSDGGLTYHQTQTYGTATLDTATNTVSFVLDNAAADALTPADHPTQAFIVAVTDNLGATASTLVTFTIDGANDNPTVTAVVDHDLVEAGGIANGTAGVATATASVNKGDVDGPVLSYDNAALLTAGWATGDGGLTYHQTSTYGTATLDIATNTVSFALDNAAADALTPADHPTQAFIVAVTDNLGATASTLVTFTIDGSNDAPQLAHIPTGIAYSPGGLAIQLAPNLVLSDVSDVDGTTLSSATVKITGGVFVGDGNQLAVNVAGTSISGVFNFATETLTLSGTDTLAHYEQVLKSVTFQSTSADPTNGGLNPSRTVQWQLNDGGATGNLSAFSTEVVAMQTLDLDTTALGTGYSASFTEGGDAVPVVGPHVHIEDPLSTTAASATVTLTNALAGDSLSIIGSLPSGLSATIDTSVPGQITVTLSGVKSLATYEAALQQIGFANDQGDPITTNRQIDITVNDGAFNTNTARTTVKVIDIDTPSVIGIAGGSLIYTENQAPTPIDAVLTLKDIDSTNLLGATVVVSGNYHPGEDILGFTDQNGIVGTFNAATGTLTLSGAASVANYRAALQSITYFNTSDNPSGQTRSISYQVTDDTAVASNVATTTVAVIPVNDNPVVVAGSVLDYNANFGQTVALEPKLALSDVDNVTMQGATVTIGNFHPGDVLSYVSYGGIAGSYNASTGVMTMSGTASLADYQASLASISFFSRSPASGVRTISWVADDGSAEHNLSAAAVTTVNVTGLILPPLQSGTPAAALLPTESGSAPGGTGGYQFVGFDRAGLPGPLPGGGTGGGFYIVTTPAQVVDASDGAFIVQVPVAALEAPFGGGVAVFGAQLADGSPLPPWMHFDPATGLLSVDLPNTVTASLQNGAGGSEDPNDDILTGGIGGGSADELPSGAQGAVQIEIYARDANGNLAKLIFTIDLAPKQPHTEWLTPGLEKFAMLSAADLAIDLGGWTPSDGAHVTAAEPAAGRPGLSQQMAAFGWQAMHAERLALIASVQRRGLH